MQYFITQIYLVEDSAQMPQEQLIHSFTLLKVGVSIRYPLQRAVPSMIPI